MRFMTIVRARETGAFPPPALIEAINKLSEESAKSGVFVGTGGLLPSAVNGARVRLAGGRITITDGPFTEAKEVIGGYAIFNLKSKEEALDAAVRFMELHRIHWPEWEGETEVRQMWEPDASPPCAPGKA